MKQPYITTIDITDVSIGYKDKRQTTIVSNQLNLQIYNGEMVCLIGPNGCGKSTLIRTLAGMQAPLSGKITIEGENISSLKLEKLAHKMSVVLTDNIDIQNMTIFDIVAIGRYPHTNWYNKLSEKDYSIISDSIQKVGLQDLQKHDFQQLSDGEKQRTMIAKALAQDTPFILLDEPTAHLDLPNRIEVIKLLKELAHTTNKSILLSTHELDLALQIADRIWLMERNKSMLCGTPEDLVLNGSFAQVFKTQSFDFDISNGLFVINHNYSKKVSLTGDGINKFWTVRALHRHGIAICEQTSNIPHIEITKNTWILKKAEKEFVCNSIFDLLRNLNTLN